MADIKRQIFNIRLDPKVIRAIKKAARSEGTYLYIWAERAFNAAIEVGKKEE